MLSDNIKKYRKENAMSQDELAEKLGVSRQSVSLWETGQTQPTIDNIIALAKIFNVSTDEILGKAVEKPVYESAPEKKKNPLLAVGITFFALVVLAASVYAIVLTINNARLPDPNIGGDTASAPETTAAPMTTSAPETTASPVTEEPPKAAIDLFAYCKDFALKTGRVNGDYVIYMQPASKYGGYENEYFTIEYWSGYDKVEFCLHCPLTENQSINFSLIMRGGYDHKYEYVSSKYYRNDGEIIRQAQGFIDPSVFSDSYPLNCESYKGSFDGQNEFMEESRVGICDLIRCLKKFVEVEGMECGFEAFEFVNY